MGNDYADSIRWLYGRPLRELAALPPRRNMDSADLTALVGKRINSLTVGQYETWIEVEGGYELHFEPVLENKDEKTGNAYARLLVRVVA